MARDNNTYAKRQRERLKKERGQAKRERRRKRKEIAADAEGADKSDTTDQGATR